MSSDSPITESQILAQRLKLCDTIRIVREQRGYTQEQLAELMQISRSTISKIENGKFSITVDYLIRFSIFLDYQFVVPMSLQEYNALCATSHELSSRENEKRLDSAIQKLKSGKSVDKNLIEE